ncbi:2-oxoisovalerate dehydrogenase subunit alpha 1, mitochondrial-like isoform X2 [Herrania umbratica]|uniref:2-oxoisovalerate dehydrogenase subunit alpha 1, mitochondrial-like isoform X2 n=1 Tax=Herrania umbratica TaxID=108875 RepID=A0A6J1ADJ5_9ROSI|nr:2-oxoisovalerate dehydrogenase subunit alpha 1, mitochondrial-like isoform X2 [Herrania umbratica]
MAIWRTRSSRTIANHIRKCMNKGFMGGAVVNQSSWSSTLQSCSLSSLSSHRLVPQNCSYLHPLPCNRATLFSLQRFKSSVAERQLDSFFSSDSDDEQYREPGVLLWRGFTLQEFANQCFGNKADHGKGRQMPIHYGSKEHNFFTISSPIGTQLPQAAGIAYSLKMDNKKACAVSYIGDGGTSEGDFHAGLNFAAVMEAPVIFFCRNNGWAISTHVSEQFRSDGIVVKGQGYGIRSIRVDGNDALAVYSAVSAAREMAINEQRPILVEALTYRIGHHSTSDDSTKYRALDEIDYWKLARNPVNRFRCWVQRNGWWSEQQETELRKSIRKQLLQAIQVAEKTEKPPLTELFSDVYDHLPSNLLEQEKRLRGTISRHPKDYPSDVSV